MHLQAFRVILPRNPSLGCFHPILQSSLPQASLSSRAHTALTTPHPAPEQPAPSLTSRLSPSPALGDTTDRSPAQPCSAYPAGNLRAPPQQGNPAPPVTRKCAAADVPAQARSRLPECCRRAGEVCPYPCAVRRKGRWVKQDGCCVFLLSGSPRPLVAKGR